MDRLAESTGRLHDAGHTLLSILLYRASAQGDFFQECKETTLGCDFERPQPIVAGRRSEKAEARWRTTS
jgi:hypothetical protein